MTVAEKKVLEGVNDPEAWKKVPLHLQKALDLF